MSVVVIGGGWAGCSAAVTARKQGEEVHLLERTDMLLGLGNAGGIMRNNGRYTLTEECIAMGASELFKITDDCATHVDVDFPGHRHASFYNVKKVEPRVRRMLSDMGVKIRLMFRAVQVIKTPSDRIDAVISADGEEVYGDVFIETTGTAGPMGNCTYYGRGCSMCILRCPAFGPRVSISEKAGCHDYFGCRADGTPGAFSGSCKLDKETLGKELQEELNLRGFAVVPLPEHLINEKKLRSKVCRQYALPDFAKNIILIDTGSAKMMTPFFPLEDLRSISGFENVMYSDPYAGGKGNSIRYMACAERERGLKVKGIPNLFCAGEKAGTFVGHTEAIATGALAGYNAARYRRKEELLELPPDTTLGALIEFQEKHEGMVTCAGDRFFEHMKDKGLYTTDRKLIAERVEAAGLTGVFDMC
ncbi:MAG: FAD-dependent oxidoreductase [Firmicutes bacterium]|nr:FAD-dependent oxidoreductase [Bacillota bacterium]